MHQPGVIGHFDFNQGHGIHDRREVHQQLHAKTNEVTQIPVLGYHRGNQHPQSQSQNPHQGNQQREKQKRTIQADGCALKIIKNIKSHKNQELDTKFQQIGNHGGKWHNHPGKIDLAKYGRIPLEGIRSVCQASRKIIPNGNSRQIEQKSRHGSGIDSGHVIENDGKGNRGEQRLYQVPQRPQDGLFVDRHDIPFHEKHQ